MRYSKSLITIGLIFGCINLTADNIVKNGSFEDFDTIKGNRTWKIVNLKDWEAPDEMRIWTNRKVKTTDGEYKIELDSHKSIVDKISQTIITEENQSYKLCLDTYGRKKRSSDFQILIDDELILNAYVGGLWRKFCTNFEGKGGEQTLTIREFENQNNGGGAVIDNITIQKGEAFDKSGYSKEADNIIKAKNLSTQKYKEEWFDRAKEKWNETHPDNQYTYDYYTYRFPKESDLKVGNPPDEPILPKNWMQNAGLGFSKGIYFPYDKVGDPYSEETIKEWKKKGFKNGRFHLDVVSMADFENDPTGATLKKEHLEDLKEVCERFSNNGVPVTISFKGGSPYIDGIKDDRNETFRRIINWWRQIAETFKDSSYLIAFENFVEYHGFDDIALEKRTFEITLDNNETHYDGYKSIYRKRKITNVVSSPGYNNLMAEIAKVIRVTNPKRIFLYKPNGIGRAGMTKVTPWRWGPEGDYLEINNKKTPYWLISFGGGANLRTSYVKGIRSSDPEEREAYIEEAKRNSWGGGVHFYNGTHIPVWVSLFGIKADLEPTIEYLDGKDITTDEVVSYVKWYMDGIQNSAFDEDGNPVKLSAGFQQSWWLWDYNKHEWKIGGNRWEMDKIRDALSEYAFKYPQD